MTFVTTSTTIKPSALFSQPSVRDVEAIAKVRANEATTMRPCRVKIGSRFRIEESGTGNGYP